MKKSFSSLLVIAVLISFTGCSKSNTTAVNTPGDTQKITASADTTPGDSSSPVIVIDPGHQEKGDLSKEAIGPGSSVSKVKVSSGAVGKYSKVREAETNLKVSLLLQEYLESDGFKVILTHNTLDVNLSNQERAEIGNTNNAAAIVHIHCDSITGSKVHGAETLVPSNENPYLDKDIIKESRTLGEDIIESFCKETDAKNRGTSNRDDLTGINWSKVPVTYVEMGFISNKEEDQKLNDSDYQNLCAKGIANGIKKYLE